MLLSLEPDISDFLRGGDARAELDEVLRRCREERLNVVEGLTALRSYLRETGDTETVRQALRKEYCWTWDAVYEWMGGEA